MSKQKTVLIVFLSLLWPPLWAMAGETPLDYITAMDRASAHLSAGLAKENFKRIAVTGIATPEGDRNALTSLLGECLVTRLVNLGYSVVERSRLEQVANENKRSSGRAFDRKSAVKIGNFLAADAVIVGTLTMFRESCLLHIRAVGCLPGVVARDNAYETRIKMDEDIRALMDLNTSLTISVFPSDTKGTLYLDGKIAGTLTPGKNIITLQGIRPGAHKIRVASSGYPAREQEVVVTGKHQAVMNLRMFVPLEIKVWQEEDESGRTIGNNGTVYNGNHYRFCFKSNRDCYVYMFNRGTSGRFFTLVPNDQLKTDNHVRAGKVLKVPGPHLNGFLLSGNPGNEKIYVIASIEPVEDLDALAGELSGRTFTAKGFSQMVEERIPQQAFTKDYRMPEDTAAVIHSASLDDMGQVSMELQYRHE